MKKLCLTFLCLLVAVGVFAQRGTCGTGVSWKLVDGVLTISGDGEMYDFGASSNPTPSWDVYKEDITHVVVESGINNVGNSAFNQYPQLQHVSLAEGVQVIGVSAFSGCSAIKEMVFPESIHTIGGNAFSGTGLSELTVPEGLESIGSGAFSLCVSLTTVNWNAVNCVLDGNHSPFCNGRWDQKGDPIVEVRFGEKVRQVPSLLFSYCSMLKTLKTSGSISRVGLGAFNGTLWLADQPMGAVIYIDNALYAYQGEMTKATTIDIPEGKESITDNAFQGCKYLVGLSVPSTMQSIGDNAFEGCTALGRIVWNAVDCEDFTKTPLSGAALYEVEFGSRVQAIPGNMFSGCDGLESLNFPESLRRIGDDAFRGSKGLKFVSFPTELSVIGNRAFQNCSKMEELVIPEGLTYLGNEAFGNNTSLKKVVFNAIDCRGESVGRRLDFSPFNGDTDFETFVIGEKVTYLPKDICWNKGKLKEIVIPNSVKEIGQSAFEGCSGLVALTVGEGVEKWGNYAFEYTNVKNLVWNAVNVVYEGISSQRRLVSSTAIETLQLGEKVNRIPSYLCYGCAGLKDFVIPENVEVIGEGAFGNCSSLTKVAIPKSVSVVEASAFVGCKNIKALEVGEGVTRLNGLSGCSGLESVVWRAVRCEEGSLPYGISHLAFGDKVESVPAELCYKCSLLTQVQFPGSVTSIGKSAFASCVGLKSVELPASLIMLGESAFSGCSALTEVKLPVSLTNIPQNAFASTGLLSVFIPASITEVANGAFSNNKQLKRVIVASNEPAKISTPFTGCKELTGIFVPDVVAYSTAEGWSAYARLVYPMVSPDEDEFVYSGQAPALSFTNHLSDYTLQLETAEAEVAAGRYVGQLTAHYTGMNEFEVQVPYAYTIHKALLTVVPKDAERVYGDANPSLEYAIEGFVNDETQETDVEVLPRLQILNAGNTAAVGKYLIGLDNEPYARNYDFVVQNAYLTISPRPLSVSVQHATRRYREENPDFILLYEGFAYNEDMTVLQRMPYAVCDANYWSAAGDYEVTVQGGYDANYVFTYIPGILHIDKGQQHIVWEQEITDARVGDVIYLYGAWADSELPVSYESADEDVCTVVVSEGHVQLVCKTAGVACVRAVQAGNENWAVAEPVMKQFVVNATTAVEDGAVAESVTCTVGNRAIVVRGVESDSIIRIYNMNGVMLYEDSGCGGEQRFAVAVPGIYVVRVDDRIFKVAVRR